MIRCLPFFLITCLLNPLTGITPSEKVEYKDTDKGPLILDVFYPDGHSKKDKRPAIIFFFGGGWSGGSPSHFYPQASYLASRGMVAIRAMSNGPSLTRTQPAPRCRPRWLLSRRSPNQTADGPPPRSGSRAASLMERTRFSS